MENLLVHSGEPIGERSALPRYRLAPRLHAVRRNQWGVYLECYPALSVGFRGVCRGRAVGHAASRSTTALSIFATRTAFAMPKDLRILI